MDLILRCLLLFMIVVSTRASDRNLSFVLNPECIINCDDVWLLYGKGESATDEIHYFWSASMNPSFLIATSSLNTEVSINWESFQKMETNSIQMDPSPSSLFGVSFQQLILYDDKNDTASLQNIPTNEILYFPLSDFSWALGDLNGTSLEWTMKIKATKYKETFLSNDTELSFQIKSFGANGRSEELPHLLTTQNSSEIKITLKNLFTNSNDTADFANALHSKGAPVAGFHSPRWALDTIILSRSDEQNASFTFSSHKSLDDEYSPGVFTLNNIELMSNHTKTKDGEFIQWRPVAYLKPDGDINSCTSVAVNTSFVPIDERHINATKKTLVHVFFGDMDKVLGTQSIVNIGRPLDGFYNKYNYTQWTFSFGFGGSPVESTSFLVIIVILVGLGLPILCLIGGITAVCLIKKRRKRYALLSESE